MEKYLLKVTFFFYFEVCGLFMPFLFAFGRKPVFGLFNSKKLSSLTKVKTLRI